jgi:hypothetical protein
VILLSASVTLGLASLGTRARAADDGDRCAAGAAGRAAREVGKLTALGADTAAGLRVLRGISGENAFFRY